MSVCMYVVCMYVYIYLCACMYVYMYVCMYVYLALSITHSRVYVVELSWERVFT